MNKRFKDILVVWTFLAGFYVSLNVLTGLIFDFLGVLFFSAMAYGIVAIWKE
jgi:hypothetical protein